MYCMNCGTKNPDEARYCGNCGASMAGGQVSAQRLTAPPPARRFNWVWLAGALALFAFVAALVYFLPGFQQSQPARRILYAKFSQQPGVSGIYEMGLDGSNPRQVQAIESGPFGEEMYYAEFSAKREKLIYLTSPENQYWFSDLSAPPLLLDELTAGVDNEDAVLIAWSLDAISWTPDDKMIAYPYSGDLDAPKTKIKALDNDREQILSGVMKVLWSPDGNSRLEYSIDIELESTRLAITDLRTDKTRTVLTLTPPGFVLPFAWSPNGKQILTTGYVEDADTWDLYLVQVNGDPPLQLTDTADLSEQYSAWSPDGRQIAYGVGGGLNRLSFDAIEIIPSVGDAEPRRVVSQSGVGKFVWSPDGENILFSGISGDTSDLFTVNLTSGVITQLTDTPEYELFATYAP